MSSEYSKFNTLYTSHLIDVMRNELMKYLINIKGPKFSSILKVGKRMKLKCKIRVNSLILRGKGYKL